MFIIIELQTNANGSVGNIVTATTNRQDAESQYHAKLSAAAISELPIHAVVMMTNEGVLLKKEVYYHGSTPSEES